jgi:hypothetical protein
MQSHDPVCPKPAIRLQSGSVTVPGASSSAVANNRSRLVKARQAAKVLAEVDAKHDNAHGSAPSRSENQNR